MLGVLLPAVVELVKGFFGNWQASQEDKRQIAAAVAQNKIRLALSEQEHNQEWEMAALVGKDNWLRRASFFLWSFPLAWAYFSPEAAKAYFNESLAGLPSWYIGGYLAVTGAVWGLSELKAAGVLNK